LTDAPAASPGGTGGRESPVTGVERGEGGVVVSLAGELDLYNAEEVRAALVEASESGTTLLVVDLEQVRFIDSTALGVLIEGRARLSDRQGFRLARGVRARPALPRLRDRGGGARSPELSAAHDLPERRRRWHTSRSFPPLR
jgi:anti-anti-sigma factor